VKGVDGLSAAPLANDEAEMAQQTKLVRDGRLLH
jgi:hypothetical protein